VRLAHLADLHLGCRMLDRYTAGGQNVREKDVELALSRAVADICRWRPDVVLIAGDVFDSPFPRPRAVIFLMSQLQALRSAGAAVVVVAGNHDTPRSSVDAPMLPLYQSLGVKVVCQGIVKLWPIPELTVWCAPSASIRQMTGDAMPDPEPQTRNVLLIHGAAPGYNSLSGGGGEFPMELLRKPWDYVALGHFHVFSHVTEAACYSGSLDYVSSDPWGELRAQEQLGVPGKGWVAVDLPEDRSIGAVVSFRPIEPARRFLDLVDITCGPEMTPEALSAMIRDALSSQDITDAVVRVVVRDCPRQLKRSLDHAMIRKFKAQALALRLDIRPPYEESPDPVRIEQKRASLALQLDAALTEMALPPNVDRAELRKLGQFYLEKVKPRLPGSE